MKLAFPKLTKIPARDTALPPVKLKTRPVWLCGAAPLRITRSWESGVEDLLKRILFTLLILGLASAPAFASGIVYDCDASISTLSSNVFGNGATICNALNSTISGQYASIFTNANAVIYVEYAATDGVASNTQFLNTVTYANYLSALTSHESGAADVMAVNSLGAGSTNPVVSGDGVSVSSALDSALGLSGAYGIKQTSPGNFSSCAVISVANSCFNDIITVSSSYSYYYASVSGAPAYSSGEYDFFSSVEHETDESLGTESCIPNTSSGTPAPSAGCANGVGQGVSAADLFRYSADGVRSYMGTGGSQDEGSLAYFSINSGKNNIVSYNNTTNGADYGDFSTTCTYVQDAYGCPTSAAAGVNIVNDGGVEAALLDSVGYNLTATGKSISAADALIAPEPGTVGSAAGGFLLIGITVARRRRAASLAGSINR